MITKLRAYSIALYVIVMKRQENFLKTAHFGIQMHPFKFQELWIVIYIQGI